MTAARVRTNFDTLAKVMKVTAKTTNMAAKNKNLIDCLDGMLPSSGTTTRAMQGKSKDAPAACCWTRGFDSFGLDGRRFGLDGVRFLGTQGAGTNDTRVARRGGIRSACQDCGMARRADMPGPSCRPSSLSREKQISVGPRGLQKSSSTPNLASVSNPDTAPAVLREFLNMHPRHPSDLTSVDLNGKKPTLVTT